MFDRLPLYLLILFGLFLPTTPLLAGEQQLRQATEAYDQGDFAESAQLYEQVLTSHPGNGHVLYNLGNAYYRLDKPGKAMAAFLAAKRLLPRDPDIKANLVYLHNQIQDQLDYNLDRGLLSVLAFWQGSFTPTEIFIGFLCLWWLGLLVLGIYLWRKDLLILKRFGLGAIVLACFTLSAFFISSGLDARWGAVSAANAAVRSGPGESNTMVFELHQAAPIVIDQEAGDWFLISLSDGKKGWISKSQTTAY